MQRKIAYTLKLNSLGLQMATRKINNYKSAFKEAESWVLSGVNYTCTIEWETVTGNKTINLDHQYVTQQRKYRKEYKKVVKQNTFRNSYVAH